MRASFLVCVFALACGDPPAEPTPVAPASAEQPAVHTRRLELPHVAVDAPASFVDLEPDRVERLRQAALQQDPAGTAEVMAVRAPSSMTDGTIYIQSGAARRSTSAQALTVKQALEKESEHMHALLKGPGGGAVDFSATSKDDALEVRASIRMNQGDRAVSLRLAAALFVRPDGRLGTESIACMADPTKADDLCNPAFDSHRFTLPASKRKFDEVLPPNTRPLGFVRDRDVAGIVFGASVADFRAACRKAGHGVDPYDWKVEPPQVKEWVKDGRMSSCTGLPVPGTGETAFGLGKVVGVNAMVTDGKVATATIFLDVPPEQVGSRMAEAYPEGVADRGLVVHVIATAPPNDDDLVSVTVGTSNVRGAKSSVTFMSKRGSTAPPLPGAPPPPPKTPPR